MLNKFLSSNRKNTKLPSLKEKGFRNEVVNSNEETGIIFDYKVFNSNSETISNRLDITPDSSTEYSFVDTFCEKPSYVPMLNKRDDQELYNKAKSYSLYFPLTDRLDGYKLYNSFYSEYLQAKGILLEDDDTAYYEYVNGRYRLKTNLPINTDLSNYFIKLNNVSLDRLANTSLDSYKNQAFLTGSGYGQIINYFYDGIAPGTSEKCNLLYGIEPVIEYNNGPSPEEPYQESKSIYRTKSYLLTLSNEYYITFSFNISSDKIDGNKDYAISFFARIDDTIKNDGVENVNERLVIQLDDVSVNPGNNISITTDWNQYKFYVKGQDISDNNNQIVLTLPRLTKETLKVKLCGFLLNEGNYIVNFDDRYHIKHAEDNEDNNLIKYPVLISFLNNDEAFQTKMNKNSSWTVNYKRLTNISDNNKESDIFEKIDQVGPQLLGYPEGDYSISDFLGVFTNVFLTYNNETNKLRYIIFSEDNRIEYTYSISSQEGFDLFVPEDNRIYFNLILGGYIEDNTIKVNNFCRYNDLMVFPYILSDEEIEKMNNVFMSINFGGKAYNEYYDINDLEVDQNDSTKKCPKQKYTLRDNLSILRSSNFVETKNI